MALIGPLESAHLDDSTPFGGGLERFRFQIVPATTTVLASKRRDITSRCTPVCPGTNFYAPINKLLTSWKRSWGCCFFFFLSRCPFLLALAVLSSLLILFQTVISVFAAHAASHRSLVHRVIVPCNNVAVVLSWPDGCFGKTGSSVRLPSQQQGRQRKDKIAVSPTSVLW